jgi:hypothetical protein
MFGEVLATGLSTGLSPAQQIDITKYYNSEQEKKPDYTYIVIIAAALLIAGGTIYFITRK